MDSGYTVHWDSFYDTFTKAVLESAEYLKLKPVTFKTSNTVGEIDNLNEIIEKEKKEVEEYYDVNTSDSREGVT